MNALEFARREARARVVAHHTMGVTGERFLAGGREYAYQSYEVLRVQVAHQGGTWPIAVWDSAGVELTLDGAGAVEYLGAAAIMLEARARVAAGKLAEIAALDTVEALEAYDAAVGFSPSLEPPPQPDDAEEAAERAADVAEAVRRLDAGRDRDPDPPETQADIDRRRADAERRLRERRLELDRQRGLREAAVEARR